MNSASSHLSHLETTGNLLFKNALFKTPQKVPPIWMMRQAGRYHKHYQNLKKQYSFMDLCKNPELAAETALGPILDFDFDVSILFSDLLFPLEALGFGLSYPEGLGPQLGWHINTSEDFIRLKSTEEAKEQLLFQKKALEITRERLPKNKSLLGFVGGPWTLFSYAVQGRHDGNLIETKKRISLFQTFNEHMVPLLIENIKLQIMGGAEIVMLFDTAAGELSPQLFRDYVWPVLEVLSREFPHKLGYYSKNTTERHYFNSQEEAAPLSLFNLPWAGFGVDHRYFIVDYLKAEHAGFVQGNFDQSLLFLDNETFRSELRKYLKPIKALTLEERAGWVCGLGHGVLPKTPEANVKDFVAIVREEFSK